MKKSEIVDQIRAGLRLRLERLSKAAHEAHAAATDPGSKAEGKYDTRSLEASYLASGQARQVAELAESVRIFDTLEPPDFQTQDPVDAGALVEVEIGGETEFYLLVPAAGGLVIRHDAIEITLLTPESVLYRKLLGLGVGDSLEAPALVVTGIC